MERKYFFEADLLRVLATFAVVMIHVTSVILLKNPIDNISEIYYLFFNQLSRFAVPAFLFLSGFGLAISTPVVLSFKNFIIKRVVKLLPLYIIYSLFYLFVTHKDFSFLNTVKALILGKACYHLYFVPLVLQFYLIYPFISKIKLNFKIVLAVFLFNIFILYANYYENIDFGHFFSKKSMLMWVFYFIFGIYFAQNISKFKNILQSKNNFKILLTATIGSLLYLFIESFSRIKNGFDMHATISQMRPSVVLSSTIFSCWIFSLDISNFREKIIKTVKSLSANAYGVYLIHPFFIMAFKKLFFIKHDLLFLILGFIFTYVGSFFMTSIINNLTKYLKITIIDIAEKRGAC